MCTWAQPTAGLDLLGQVAQPLGLVAHLDYDGAGGGPAGFRRRLVTRCSGEGPGSKVVGWWTHFGAARRKSSPEERAQRRGVVDRRGTVVGAASGCGGQRLGVRGGCTRCCGAQGMVETVGERPEQAVHGGSATVGMAAQWGGKKRWRKKGCSTVGVGALYSRQRRWTAAAWRWGNGGWGNSGGEIVGIGKVAAATILKRSVRSRRRRSERLTLGAYGVLIFPIYSKLAQLGNRERMSYLPPKIPKFCMLLDWGIMNTLSIVLTSKSQ
jgi:hypothetical protein